jgi:4-amino-4-deoxy-L-arabinose transferase-like glycosyltransferase
LDAPAAATDTPPETAAAHLRATTRERIGLTVLLIGTGVMYLWNITVNGMGNQFYAGAAQAGSKNWEALLFGSLDRHNFITVDKPPVSQWVMGLSGQLFGFNSASMLIPQALMAVASVALLYAAVTRISGRRAGLLAGAVLALTPVAVLMFRFNNPDAVMVLLMMAAAYCTVRALTRATVVWMAWAGVALGFVFLAKMLEGLMVAPALALAYLIAAPTSVRRRLLHLGVGLVALAASAGWFVLVTLWWPASSRPYIAGSTDNNFMNLVLGYNGFSRVLGHNWPGQHQGAIGQAAGDRLMTHNQGGFGGNQTQGLARLFSGEFGFEIGWLVPAALLAIVLVIIARGRAPRTDLVRAAVIVFGGWIVVDGLVLSFMNGMIHSYYCLSIAPAVAGMFAIGVLQMWERRDSWFGRSGLALMLLTTGVWSFWLLRRNADWLPALRWIILVVVVAASLAVLFVNVVGVSRRHLASAAVAVALVGALAGSTAYAIATIGQPHTGGGPNVGPASSARHSFGWGQFEDNPQLDEMLAATTTEWSAAVERSSAAANLELSSNTAVMAVGGFSGRDPVPTLDEFISDVHNQRVAYYIVMDTHGRGPWGRTGHVDIARWVRANFTATKVGSATVYDLSTPR